MDNLIGRSFDGYKLIEFVEADGPVCLYKGFDDKLSRWVTVKAVSIEAGGLMTEDDLPASLRRQIQAIADLRHHNISIMHRFGVSDGHLYFIMEYVVGGSLQDRLNSHKPFMWEKALSIIIPISQALAFAHNRGILHMDISSANILMIQDDWPVLVADFGASKMQRTVSNMTMPGPVMGTMTYAAAPEEIRGKEIDARSNIYSLAIILYELLAGELPFEGQTVFDTVMARLTEPPRAVQVVNPDVPFILAPILDKALALNPNDRYQMMAEFSQSLIDARKELRRLGEAQSHSAKKESGVEITEVSDPGSPANIILKLAQTGQEFSIGNQVELTVGRARKNEIPTIDLTPYGGREAGVSRQHGRLLHKDNQWFIEDLSSTNGTFVNGAKIPPHHFIPVQMGDMLRFGEIELEFGLLE